MQYTFFINQKRLYELGLDKQFDVIDLLLFDAIYKWFNNEDMLRIVNGTTYIEIRHNLITTECPILGINHRDTFRKRMLKLVSAGLLERYQNNQTENSSLYKRGRLFNCFDSDKGVQIEIGNVPTQIGRGADKNRQGVQIEVGTNNIQNNNIQNNKYIPPISPTGDCECEVEVLSKEKELFEAFRKAYRGTKRGLDTEFSNFKKKHKDWKQVAPLLLPAYEKQLEQLDQKKAIGAFVPQPKNLQTYINQRCWEEEISKQITNENGNNTGQTATITARTIDGVTYGNAYTSSIRGLL